MKNIEWCNDALVLLDQTKLPTQVEYIHCTDWRQVAEAIKMLRVRGAPAIGVAAGYGLILAANEANRLEAPFSEQISAFYEWSEELKETRPTAINLAWAVNRVMAIVKAGQFDAMNEVVDRITKEAIAIHKEDVELNTRMAINGATLFEGKKHLRILTHCNAGALATGGLGTALGVIRKLHEQDQLEMVYADETRPLLQGARLTAFELHEDEIPVTLETDNMAAYAMQQGSIDAIIVGADRITTQGDVANKIGTYGLAVLAKFHNIPFYVAAPYSTFDFTLKHGKDIPIEMRTDDEVLTFQGVPSAPTGIHVLNPAFDITPHELVTAIITEEGVLTPDYQEAIARLQSVVEAK